MAWREVVGGPINNPAPLPDPLTMPGAAREAAHPPRPVLPRAVPSTAVSSKVQPMRSLRERLIHTALFEALAVVVVTPAVMGLTGAAVADAGTLSVVVSVGAVVANYGWTMLFDRFVPTRRRGLWLRFLQAAGLEAIIMAYTLPLILWFTGIGFWSAVALDLGGVAFFLAFAMLYNAAFDGVMLRIAARSDGGAV